jgi:cytochrome b involved in lipid metabolism
MRRQIRNWSRTSFRSIGVSKTSRNLTYLIPFRNDSSRYDYSWDDGATSSESDQYSNSRLVNCFFTLLICVAAKLSDSCSAEASTTEQEVIDSSKPVYRRDEIKQHSSKEKGIWVTFGNKVYDITKFVVNHPGGQDKIMLAAGGSAEPFWKIYRQHYNSQLAPNALKPLFIGYLHPDDFTSETAEQVLSNDDPYSRDPSVSPIQTFHQRKPINSETPPALLSDTWVTPKEMWFNRNHHPVPNLVAEDYKLSISGPGIGGGKVEYTLDDLKTKFKKYKVSSNQLYRFTYLFQFVPILVSYFSSAYLITSCRSLQLFSAGAIGGVK